VLLASIEIDLSPEYDSDGETSTGFALLLYTSSSINSIPFYNISQHDQLIRQYQEQITILQMLIA